MKRVVVTTAIALCLCLSLTRGDEPRPSQSDVIVPNSPARLVELRAHLRVKNSSDTDVSRFVFRVTEPPDTESQRSLLQSSDVTPATRKKHKSAQNDYLEFEFPVDANKEVINRVSFLVLLLPVDYARVKRIANRDELDDANLDHYTKPSRYIESDSPEIKKAAAQIFRGARTDLMKARAAYELPSKVLKFQLQREILGAQRALQTQTGDCTDYACLFAALCRSQSLPSRRIAAFNLGPNTSISVDQPNHDIAELYLPTHGWLPVDSNLGQGRYDRPIGFGRLNNTIVLLNREGAWVWSTWLPPNGYDSTMTKPTLKYGVSWDAKVVKQAPAEELFREFAAINSQEQSK